MKRILLIMLIFCSMLSGDAKPSYAGSPYIPGIYVPGLSKTEFKICEIRRIFCGKLAFVIVTISIFLMGMMIMVNKLHWSTAMLIIAGMLIFLKPESIVTMFGKADSLVFVLNPTCSCSCNPSINWLNPLDWFNKKNKAKCF